MRSTSSPILRNTYLSRKIIQQRQFCEEVRVRRRSKAKIVEFPLGRDAQSISILANRLVLESVSFSKISNSNYLDLQGMSTTSLVAEARETAMPINALITSQGSPP